MKTSKLKNSIFSINKVPILSNFDSKGSDPVSLISKIEFIPNSSIATSLFFSSNSRVYHLIIISMPFIKTVDMSIIKNKTKAIFSFLFMLVYCSLSV